MNESNQLLAAAPVPKAFFKLAAPAVDSALMMATANLRKWATAQNFQKGQNSRNKRKAPSQREAFHSHLCSSIFNWLQPPPKRCIIYSNIYSGG